MKSVFLPKNPSILKKVVYPYLGLFEGKTEPISKFIVLFTGPETGMVVWSNNISEKVGNKSAGWYEAGFKYLDNSATVTLSNEE